MQKKVKKLTFFIPILFILIFSFVSLTSWKRSIHKMGLQGKIVFRNTEKSVWIMDLSSGRCRKIAINEVVSIADPAVSLDGKKVAYGVVGLCIADVDGTNQKKLAPGICRSPTWSSDSKRIAFCANRKGKVGIYVIDVDGKNETLITEAAGSNIGLGCSWSPDGKKIAFVLSDKIYTMSPDGSNKTRLTTSRMNEYPAWSPDGKRIVFTFCEGGYEGDIYIMNSDGSNQTRLTFKAKKNYSNVEPKWSADGKKIFYWMVPDIPIFSKYFYVMNPDGSDNIRLRKITGFRQIWEELLAK